MQAHICEPVKQPWLYSCRKTSATVFNRLDIDHQVDHGGDYNVPKLAPMATFFFFFLFPLLLILASFLFSALNKRSGTRPLQKPSSQIASPPSLPILGHFHLLSSALPKSFQALAHQYGPLIRLKIGSSEFLVASSAALAREILRTHDAIFANKFVFSPTRYNIYKEAEFVNAPYGTYWKFMKRLCMTKLFAGPQLDRFSHIREEEIMKLLRSLWECFEDGLTCDLSTKLTAMTNNMICRMAMSKKCSSDDKQSAVIRETVKEIVVCGSKLSFAEVHGPLKHVDLFGRGKKIKMAMLRYDSMMNQIIKDYEHHGRTGEDEEQDVMDILLDTYRDPTAEIRLTMDQIKHFFLDILIAGVDTTSASIQWAMIELLNRPEALTKLRDEIDSVVGTSRLVKESDIPNLPYLRGIVRETLRLHTSGPLIRRKSSQNSQIGGYDVKAGTNILINAYALMHDPDVWEEPNEFRPERFLKEDRAGTELKKGKDMNYFPFGSGRRACIGEAHAENVMHTAIGALVQCFDWRMDVGEKSNIKMVTGYSGAVANALMCSPVGRLNPMALCVGN
ncbi:hypothetical protein MLD38_008050 [Melastoma candidum]|uniref:Uncharacterized protein n=1 Tax=Melastoma candidum TaxID=119954 RepID=A0ACB9RWT4_9MYRT|nr:hypothetical protein MLD38_008050 [Melastoma candidum]